MFVKILLRIIFLFEKLWLYLPINSYFEKYEDSCQYR